MNVAECMFMNVAKVSTEYKDCIPLELLQRAEITSPNGHRRRYPMRALLIAAGVAALMSVPAADPATAGVRVGPFWFHGHHHHYGYGADCRDLREACLRKGELGETGQGNCRRYRAICHGY